MGLVLFEFDFQQFRFLALLLPQFRVVNRATQPSQFQVRAQDLQILQPQTKECRRQSGNAITFSVAAHSNLVVKQFFMTLHLFLGLLDAIFQISETGPAGPQFRGAALHQ